MNSNSIRRSPLMRLALLAGAGVVALAGCSNGSGIYGGGGQPQGAASAPRANTTVTVATVSGRQILETATGRALYVNDEEDGMIVGTSHAFTTVWIPLLTTAGHSPTSPASVTGKVATIKRPDGTAQVTLDGKPLYTFEFDRGPGQVSGEGAKDSFDGTSFTWHAATADRTAAPAATSAGSNAYSY
jgi:predicted lipoprotein with Yx(FWY)xxD motif